MSVRKLIGPPSVWTEPFSELVIRWHKRLPEEERDAVGSASIAAQRATERATRVLEYSGLERAPEIQSARQWETRWNAAAQWKRLCEHLKRIEVEVVYDGGGSGRGADLNRRALEAAGDSEAVLIVERTLVEQRELARAQQCPLELSVDDLSVLALAREVFAIESVRIGRPPRAPWVDDLASCEFPRLLLGLPFSPLVFQLIGR